MTTENTLIAQCGRCQAFKPINESRLLAPEVISSSDAGTVTVRPRVCFTCQPHAVGDWRVSRQLAHPASEDVAAGAYQNYGPYVTRSEALEARAIKMSADAIYHLRTRSPLLAGNIFLALTINYEASQITVGDTVAWSVFQL